MPRCQSWRARKCATLLDDVRRTAPQVGVSVAVGVDRIAAIAAGHELGHAHRARERSLGGERRDAELAREKQELLQLAPEEGGAARIVEGERGERVEHPIVADVLAVERLDAEDRDDDLGRHSVALLGPREVALVGAPVRDAGRHARGREERPRIDVPFRRLEQRPIHRGHDRALEAHLPEHARERRALEAVFVGHLGR